MQSPEMRRLISRKGSSVSEIVCVNCKGRYSAMVTNRGRGRRCVSSFVSGHASGAALILIFSSFEVRAGVYNKSQILNQILVSVALNINEHSTGEQHSPKTPAHFLRFWHFQQHSQLLFPYCSNKCYAAYEVFNFQDKTLPFSVSPTCTNQN